LGALEQDEGGDLLSGTHRTTLYGNPTPIYKGTIQVTGSFTSSSKGILYEGAGQGTGVIVYIDDGKIKARCGKGVEFPATGDVYSIVGDYTIGGSETVTDIVYTMNLSDSGSWTGSRLYINNSHETSGSLVGTGQGELVGGGQGGSGTAYQEGVSTVVYNTLTLGEYPFDTNNGTITNVYLWRDKYIS